MRYSIDSYTLQSKTLTWAWTMRNVRDVGSKKKTWTGMTVSVRPYLPTNKMTE